MFVFISCNILLIILETVKWDLIYLLMVSLQDTSDNRAKDNELITGVSKLRIGESPKRKVSTQGIESNSEYEEEMKNKWSDTYGLKPSYLEKLGIKGPIGNKVFVAKVSNYF